MGVETKLAPGRWLSRADFDRVSSEHIREAVRAILEDSVDHPFAESTDYDVLLEDGARLPPKAVFGIAARRVLGLNILPGHFRGGDRQPCFRVIRDAGYAIVPKGGDGNVPPDPAQSKWIEGDAMRETHIRYERDPKAVREKKKVFKDEHDGQLGCERCGTFPIKDCGEQFGEACIEVHHKLPLAELGRRETKLDDLMCVCANCHRILHYELRVQSAWGSAER